MEDVWAFNEGTACLIDNDSKMDRDKSEEALDIILKSLYCI